MVLTMSLEDRQEEQANADELLTIELPPKFP